MGNEHIELRCTFTRLLNKLIEYQRLSRTEMLTLLKRLYTPRKFSISEDTVAFRKRDHLSDTKNNEKLYSNLRKKRWAILTESFGKRS